MPLRGIGKSDWSCKSEGRSLLSDGQPLSTSCESPPPWNLHLPGASPPERRAALELRRAPLRAAPPTGEGRTLPQTPSPFDELSPPSSTSFTSTTVSTESREGQRGKRRARLEPGVPRGHILAAR